MAARGWEDEGRYFAQSPHQPQGAVVRESSRRDKLTYTSVTLCFSRLATDSIMTSIANAARTLEELRQGLDEAYWEATSIERKDFFYDIISAVHGELSEVAKLSVQDHHLEYEPITQEFRTARAKLSKLRKLLDDYVLRSSTATRLESLISDTVGLPGR